MRVETLRWISSDTCWRDSWLEQICSLNNSVKKTLLRQITLVQFWASALQQYKLLPGMIRDTLDLCSPSQTTPSATLFKHRVKKVWRVNIFAGIADIYWKLSHLCWEKKWSCQPAVQAPPGDFLPLKTQHQLKPLGFSPSPCFVDTTSYSQFVSVTSWSGVNRSSRIVLLSSILWKKRVTSEPVCLSSTQQLFVLLSSFTLGGQTCEHTHTQGKERPLTIQIPLWPVAELSKSTEECTNTSGYSTILQTTMKNQKPTEWSQFCHQVMTKLHLLYLIKTCYNWFLIQTNNPELWVSHRLTGSKPTNSLKWIRYHMGEESLTGPWSVWF